jgi:molybdopterin-guanine dinucleotide biosynthesis protein A
MRSISIHLEGVREVADTFPGMGPLGGLHAALTRGAARGAFVVAGDMPFFHGAAGGVLLSRKDGYDAVVPRIGGGMGSRCARFIRGPRAAPIEECCVPA